jgi:hypothetical protein
MGKVSEATLAVVWTTPYPALLARPSEELWVTRAGYTGVFGGHPHLELPWKDAMGHRWSRFWSSYLGSPKRTHDLTVDEAWDRLVPFRLKRPNELKLNATTTAHAQVLLHPGVVTVIVTIEAAGDWRIRRLASVLTNIRNAESWQLNAGRPNRSLDGIAADLCERASRFLTNAVAPDVEAESIVTVAAATEGRGRAHEFQLDNQDVKSCVAGMADLGHIAAFDSLRLIRRNANPELAARMYAGENGHTIWHPEIRTGRTKSRVTCLVHNQAHLIAQISALACIVRWAGARITGKIPIPVAVQPLVQRAALRLDQLSSGTKPRTYRSGLAQVRVEAVLEDVKTVQRSL